MSLSSAQRALSELINMIPSHVMLACWHQLLDLRQKVATENANAILVGRQDLFNRARDTRVSAVAGGRGRLLGLINKCAFPPVKRLTYRVDAVDHGFLPEVVKNIAIPALLSNLTCISQGAIAGGRR
jgi:hypothetical protein